MTPSSQISKKRKRIGLFGGTFDPFHLGHLILAQEAKEELKLDGIVFIPAKLSPHKVGEHPIVSKEHRLAMIQEAIQGEGDFHLDDRELRREGISYTIDTVRELQEESPLTEFVWLIGEDHLPKLSSWKESEELQQRVAFAVFTRGKNHELQQCDFPMIQRYIDISSTEIRERLARGASVRYFLPTPVFKYIEKLSLYKPLA